MMQDLGIDVPWWWLSFADANRPTGTQFLGVVVIQGLGIVDAGFACHRLGINPGGEIAGMEIPPGGIADVPEKARNRLLSRAEIEGLGLL